MWEKSCMAGFLRGVHGSVCFSRVKVTNPPGSGEDLDEGRGVHREVGSEGSCM